jgi:purine-binding chemotaxis protein CheW
MTIETAERDLALVVSSGARACAIPVRHVGETMRPLPIEALTGLPVFVRGVALVRGIPIPVIDLNALLQGGEITSSYGRFVTVKAGERCIALGVDGVVGLRRLESLSFVDLPPLLRDTSTDRIEAIGTCDAGLLVVLRAARIVPDHVWAALSGSGPAQ